MSEGMWWHCKWKARLPPSREQRGRSSTGFDNARRLDINQFHGPRLAELDALTLMSYPLARLNCLRPRTERHEVTLDDVLAIVGVQP